MIGAVRRNLMPSLGDLAHEGRATLGDPTQDEERAMRTTLGQELEQEVHTPIDTARQAVPVRPGDMLLERRDLEVLFHVDGEVMGDRHVRVHAYLG